MKTIADGALEHVKHLAVDIGSRPIGSAANLAAADYISQVFEQNGAEVERQEMPRPEWTAEQTSVELDGKPLEASANTFSPSCNISAATVPVCTPAELELASIEGRVLIFYGDMAQTELATKGGIYVSDPDRRIIQLLEEKHPAGVNFDGVGPITGTNTVTSFVTLQDLEALIDEKLKSYPGLIRVEPWPASDHYIFYSNGVPSIAFTSKGIRDIYHNFFDTMEWISA